MSWQSLADVFEYVQRTDDLSSAEVLVLLAIANYANTQGGNAYPSQPTLQQLTKLTTRTIRRTIRSLERRGVLTTSLQRGRRGSTEYALHLPRVVLKADTMSGYPPQKADTVTGQKADTMSADPGSEIQDPSPFSFPPSCAVPSAKTDLHHTLARLGLSPESNIYQWSMNGSTRAAGRDVDIKHS